MTFELLDEEWELVRRVPVDDLIMLAAALDIVLPAEIDARALVGHCIPRLVAHARRGGLPFSKYDLDDLQELSPDHLQVLAVIQGLRPNAGVNEVLKVGERVYRSLQGGRNGLHPIAYMVPILLTPTLRCAQAGGSHG
jgi:hypothetical protein